VAAGLPGAVADSATSEDVEDVEGVEEALEERVAILDDRRLDPLEDLTVDTLRVVLGLEHEGRDRPEQHSLAHTLRAVGAEVARDLSAPHREAGEHGVGQIEVLDQRVQVGGEGVVVVTDCRLARASEAAAV